MLLLTDDFRTTYPGAGVGVLKMSGVSNPETDAALDARVEEIEGDLRVRYADADRATLKEIPTIEAYGAYYKRFKKTYHVQLQLESVLFKGRSITGMRSLVKAMVAAELENQLLTAGHDAALLNGTLVADVSSGEESYTGFGGKDLRPKQGDMFIADATGIISSVVYGPDQRTAIGVGTERVCFTVYAVQGIPHSAVEAHLCDIRDGVLLFAPDAVVELLEVAT